MVTLHSSEKIKRNGQRKKDVINLRNSRTLTMNIPLIIMDNKLGFWQSFSFLPGSFKHSAVTCNDGVT